MRGFSLFGIALGAAAMLAATGLPTTRCGFVMPGLVEAHCHLFLDGGELDFAARTRHLDAPFERMMEVARANVGRNLAAGVTLVRDAGDDRRLDAERLIAEERLSGELQQDPAVAGFHGVTS